MSFKDEQEKMEYGVHSKSIKDFLFNKFTIIILALVLLFLFDINIFKLIK